MRAALPLLAVALFLAGCATEGAGVGGSSTRGADTGASEDGEPALAPPPRVFLESAAGGQQAVDGHTGCISGHDPSSDDVTVVQCSDGIDPAPASLSVVRPGEEIRIVLEEGEVVRPAGCSPDGEPTCAGIAYVHALGCAKETIAEIPFSVGPVTTWKAELAPGTYELDFGVNFVAPGRGGDFMGVLGLRVDEEAPLEIVPRPGDVVGCVGPDPLREP